MRAYILVEGERTEPRVYRRWLPMCFPGIEEVRRIEDMADNRFFLVAGNGYPSYLKRLDDAVADISDVPGRFDCLLVCVDTEARPYTEVYDELRDTISDPERTCPVPHHFLIADCCIETWFLGNRRFAPRQATPDLQAFYEHFSVRDQDPEVMSGMGEWLPAETCLRYFKEICAARSTRYSKVSPGPVLEADYLRRLVERTEETPHLRSMAIALEQLRRLGASI